MADNEAKGNQYLAEAQKKLKSSTGFLGGLLGFVDVCAHFCNDKTNYIIVIFSGGSRQDEAIELYVRAANSFKMAKKWNG